MKDTAQTHYWDPGDKEWFQDGNPERVTSTSEDRANTAYMVAPHGAWYRRFKSKNTPNLNFRVSS